MIRGGRARPVSKGCLAREGARCKRAPPGDTGLVRYTESSCAGALCTLDNDVA